MKNLFLIIILVAVKGKEISSHFCTDQYHIVFVLPSFSFSEVSLFKNDICSLHDNNFNVSIVTNEVVNDTLCSKYKPILVNLFVHPQDFTHLTNVDQVRIESLYRNAFDRTGMDVLAKILRISIVVLGDNFIEEKYPFLDYIFQSVRPKYICPYSKMNIKSTTFFVDIMDCNKSLSLSASTLTINKYNRNILSQSNILNIPLASSMYDLPIHDWRSFPIMNDATSSYITSIAKQQYKVSYNLFGDINRDFVCDSVDYHSFDSGGMKVINNVVIPPVPFSPPISYGTEVEAINDNDELNHKYNNTNNDVNASHTTLTTSNAADGNTHVVTNTNRTTHRTTASSSSNSSSTSTKVLCMTYTYENNHVNIKNIIQTWASRCDGYLAISNATVEEWSILYVDSEKNRVGESYHHMWKKTILIIQLIAISQLINEYDFFLIGGDDMYVIIENLKLLLRKDRIQMLNNKNTPLYLGRNLKQNEYITFNSGGSGYVLNRPAIRLLYQLLFMDHSPCLPHVLSSMEDVLVAHCLLQANITSMMDPSVILGSDELDIFHPIHPNHAYAPYADELKWYREMTYNYLVQESCCSRESISFHYISPADMLCLDYYIYNRNKM